MSLRDEAIKAMRLFYVANAHDGSYEGMCTQPTAVMADEAAEFGLDGLLDWLRSFMSGFERDLPEDADLSVLELLDLLSEEER